MTKDEIEAALRAMFSLISDRLKRAYAVAAAANTCAAAGDLDEAFHILLDMEHLTYDAGKLLNAASILRRDSRG